MTRGERIRAERRQARKEMIWGLTLGLIAPLAIYGFMHVLGAICLYFKLG